MCRSGIGKPEPSGRGRSVLFYAVGAVAASLAGVQDVEIFESGIGAINIPLMAGMTGWMSTRSCHPEFLRRMLRLVSLVSATVTSFFDFRSPSGRRERWSVRSTTPASETWLERQSRVLAIRWAISCYKQCGICSACIFRRQAMIVGGIDEPQGSYSFDLFDDTEAASGIPSEKLMYLKAFLMQVASWDQVEKTGQLPDSVYRYLLETQILSCGESPGAIIDLLVRNRDEWKAMVAERRRLGFRWARLLDPARTPLERGVSHASA